MFCQVKDLKLAQRYTFWVFGRNQHGDSGLSEPIISATSAVEPRGNDDVGDDTPLIIILTVAIIGMLLLGLNVLLILFFMRRRKKRLATDKGTSRSTSVVLDCNCTVFTSPIRSCLSMLKLY